MADMMSAALGALSGGVGGADSGVPGISGSTVKPPAPDPYELSKDNKKAASDLIDKYLKVNAATRTSFEWGWFRNLCLLAGAHDIVKLQGQVKVRPMPRYYSRVYTNKIAEKHSQLLSALMTGRVPIKHSPATDDDKARGTAEVAERVREVIYAEAKLDYKENEAGSWFWATGNVFMHPYYSYDERHGTTEVPKLECPTCKETFSTSEVEEPGVEDEQDEQAASPPAPNCPTCAAQGVASPLGPSEEVDLLPIGALCADVLSPFEIRGDLRIRDVRDWNWFIRVRRYDLSYAQETLGYKGGEEDNVDTGNTLSQHYLDVIAALNEQFNPQGGFGGLGSTNQGSQKVPKVTAYELYMLPNAQFPQGLCVVRIGKEASNVTQIVPLDSEYGAGVKKGKKFLPLVHGRAETLCGRMWGKTPLDDVVPLQYFRNRVERALDTEYKRMVNSLWMNPKGSGVDNFTGEGGQVMTYNPMVLGGTAVAKPERLVPQLQYLQYYIEFLKYLDDQIERVSLTYFLAGGQAPAGVDAASALNLLDQRSKRALSPATREWAKMWLQLDEMMLELARKHWGDRRINVATGKNTAWEVQSFMASDLVGAITMEIDYEALFPKSEATTHAMITQLIQGGVINPQDPEQKYEVLRVFGFLKMQGDVNDHTKVAQRENDEYMKSIQTGAPKLPQMIPMVDNSMIHIKEHIKLGTTQEFRALPPQLQQPMLEHIQAHFVEEGQKRALLAEMQVNPDAPGATDITGADAQAALGGASQVIQAAQQGGASAQQSPNGSGRVGNQVGSRTPKGTTGNGPNQAAATQARQKQVMTQPIPDPAQEAAKSIFGSG